ncbi:ATP-binding protein [Cohnella ginsengisoli]|uniref:histidine kinase n=1 Tax=Cohnella ginsengisoli TaxID=425004 RepID=A0A9X4KM15_9BACL|nr:ATP-binding protein [Cohnella ginsengisoli]MDG0793899.1 ATP-binding protein [Cohnella ginsengisoli]
MLKWIGIFFTLSTSPVVLLSFFSKVTSNHEWIPSEYTSWVVLLFPLSLTYLLSAKKIYDIDLVIRRFLLAIVVSFVPSILVIGLILILVSHKVRIENLMLAFTFILLLFSVTLYTLEYLTSKLERVLFPKKHYLQSSLNQISKKLGLISSFKQLKSVILIDIIDILNVHGGAIVFQHAESTEIISEGIVSHEEVMNALNDTAPSIDTGLCFELTHNQKYKSYLWLSPKKNNFMFGSEEIQWLKLIVSYLSVSMENLFLVSQMSLKLENLALQIPNENSANDIAWFRKLMFELQEKERFRIATDLHDTTMQDLFFLKRKLAALLDNYSDDWQDSEQAKSLLDYIDIINMNLRQSCFELHPYLLHELGLVRTIDKLIELERSALSFEIEFRYAGLDMIESCDMDMKRHLFRVFQELINNAKKHSNATKVHFSLNASNGKLMIQYRDNGLGFLSEQDLVREIGGSHIGLEQLKSRILSMRGVFEIKSGQGRGMSFSAVIPLKEGMTA